MNKLNAFIRLDFITIKPYFTLKNILIYAVIAVFLTITSGNIASGMGVGIMLGTMFVSYPFALGEKSSLDTLYATLSVSRKTVVSGRYLFAFALNMCAVIITFILATAGLVILNTAGTDFGEKTTETIWMSVAFSVVFIVVQSIQLPVYFKLSYSKAKFFSLVPLVALMVGYFSVSSFVKDSVFLSRAVEILESLSTAGIAVIVILVLTVIVFISYNLSLSFYKKREF